MKLFAVMLLVACAEPSSPPRVEVASFPASPVGALDLVFQVDSGAAANLQTNLRISLAPLLKLLDGVSLHVGVVTSDLGTSGGESVGAVGAGGCAGFGDGGLFRLNGASVSAPFLSTDPVNYEGTLFTTLGQMLSVGATGCGFEQPFATTRIALRAHEGFLRDDASLAIIILTDEDDCSIIDPAFFTKDETELGQLSSFRCTTQGVVCDERLDIAGPKTNCRPNRASRHVEDPELTRKDLAALRAPDRLTVSAIVGTPSPFAVEERQINGMKQLALAHSCSYQSPTGANVADPPVRIAALVESYASRGTLESACSDEYTPQVTHIATTIKRSLGTACIDQVPIDICEARDVDGTVTRTLPRCPANGDCFDIVSDPEACPETFGYARVIVDRKTTPSPTTRVDVLCD